MNDNELYNIYSRAIDSFWDSVNAELFAHNANTDENAEHISNLLKSEYEQKET